MKSPRFILTIFLICGMAFNACSQSSQVPVDVFVGSTPSGAFIKSSLGIPDSCEFIKWELTLMKSKNGVGQFQFTTLYGVSQPNTNGFKRGGKKIAASGQYTIDKNFYRLQSKDIPSPLFLLKMDDNIFHFTDSNKKLLIGNGGWGYVLNRLK